ncbi:MAG: bifunctional ADP-dependent NAD(P)H-hydrate dehydratase/NAD(P)H-hydrate epimerase [Rhodobacter sp.]|nr:bifunctional ADP-dependent NAD(P)H-hydrate dehydratase/NAD(P)H-hydrate epimerase [Rhodobacter sp.]
MTELLTAAQMRAIEAAAIASGEVTGLELMERAGRGVVEAIFEEWPELKATSHRAVVLCGPGNNGGDGFVVARLLKEWGWEVEVFLYGDPERLPPDARVNYERWRGMGTISPHDRAAPDFLGCEGLVIDAVFGTGLSRPLSGEAAKFVRAMARQGVGVSIDLPSGFCADSGRFLSAEDPEAYNCPEPQLIVTFQRGRVGHMLDQLARVDARLKVVEIGIEGFVPKRVRNPGGPGDPSIVALTSRTTARRSHEKSVILGVSRPAPHKYTHGHALILSGPSGRSGAARLAARGSLRIGAGVVTVGCPLDAIPEHAARLDAVMLRGVADAAALAGVLEDRRINALCLGPGMGTGAREAGLVGAALESRGEPRPTPDHVGRGSPRLVLDADALTILSHHPDLFAALHPGCVLTPHAGEFARLFPDIAAKLAEPATKGPAYSKVDATREAAARAGCVVLYKGPDTVIADPTGRCAINSAHYDRAAPWLATAGSGDVLAGFIAGLMARGFGPFDAACTGAWLHVECALSFGPGLIAEDLAEELPKVFRALGI